MSIRCRIAGLVVIAAVLTAAAPAPHARQARNEAYPDNYVAGSLLRLNDNGAWSWFMDPRAIVSDGKIIAGSVRAVGTFAAGAGDPRWGHVEIAVYDIATGTVAT